METNWGSKEPPPSIGTATRIRQGPVGSRIWLQGNLHRTGPSGSKTASRSCDLHWANILCSLHGDRRSLAPRVCRWIETGTSDVLPSPNPLPDACASDYRKPPWSFTPFSGFWKTICCRVSKGGQCIQAPGHPVTIPPTESSRAIEASLIRWVFHQLRHKARILRQPGQTLVVIGTTSSRYPFHLPSPGRVMPGQASLP